MRSRYSYIYIIGARHRDEALEKKTSPNIWWIQKVVVPLHSQLRRKGGRKCPIHDWRLVTTMADRSACRADLLARSRDWSEALRRLLFNTGFRQTEIDRRKNFSKYLVVSKTCRTFALTTRKKKQFALHWLKGSWAGAPNEGLDLRELQKRSLIYFITKQSKCSDLEHLDQAIPKTIKSRSTLRGQ